MFKVSPHSSRNPKTTTMATLTKSKHLIGAGLHVQRFSSLPADSMQADTVLEKQLRVLHPAPQAARGEQEATGPDLGF